MHNIDTEVHHWTSACQLLIDTPGALPKDEATVAGHLHKWSKVLLEGQPHQFFVIQVVMQAVSNGELHLCGLTSGNHAIAIGHRRSHWLF